MEAPSLIRDLSPTIVPRSLFGKLRWYRGPGGWHYHRPAGARRPRFDGSCYRFVDPLLRPICECAHRRGWRTTPSCQGHFHSQTYYEQIFETLLQEQREVRRDGLVVDDVETAQLRRFRRPDYQLPWRDVDSFYQNVCDQQRQGYLGVLLPAEQMTYGVAAWEACRQAGPEVRAALLPDGAHLLLEVVVETDEPDTQSEAWQVVGRAIQAVAAG